MRLDTPRCTAALLLSQSVVPATKELKFVSPRNELPPMGGINKPGPALRGNRDGAGKDIGIASKEM